MNKKRTIGFPALRQGTKRKKGTNIPSKWFGHTKNFYKKGQPFLTLMRKANFMQKAMIEKKIHDIVPDCTKRTALEIGPGMEPLIPSFGFKKTVFLDLSEAVAKKLKKKLPNSKVLTGDLRKLPYEITKTKERFGTIVINEVLTHLSPLERIKAIQNIANLTDSIMIIDRTQQSLAEIISNSRRNGLNILRNFEGKKSRKATLSRKRIKKESNITGREARQIQSMHVNFNSIKNLFGKKGWKTEIAEIESDGIKYSVFTAKKIK